MIMNLSMTKSERQQTYNMHEETAEFLEQVEVSEVPQSIDIPPEWRVIEIEEDKLTNWIKQNS